MNLKKINLNLLIALDALLTEQNVTRAGHKIFLSQSALSNVLKQLRELFQDELLTPQGRKLILTPKAKALHPQVKHVLMQAQAIFNPDQFDPAESRRCFILGMDECADYALLPKLYHLIHKEAPHIELIVKHVPLFAEKEMLASQEIELSIGLVPNTEILQTISNHTLFHERMVCVLNPTHPLAKNKITLKNYLDANHVSILTYQESLHIVDAELNKLGHKRDIHLKVNNVVPALYAVAKSDLIATIPESLAKEAARLLNLTIQDCPFDIPPLRFVKIWHPWTEYDAGCRWLRDCVDRAASLSSRGLTAGSSRD